MKDAKKSQYTQEYLNLLELYEQVKYNWAKIDLDNLLQTLENIRWYRQFSIE